MSEDVVEHPTATTTAATFTIPGYEIFESIGQGGMGTVYRALQTSLGRAVALKVLDPALSEAEAPTLQRESRMMAALSHPNIVAIHDSGRVGERSYLVTELIVGDSLRAGMAPGRAWSVWRALPVLDGIARALTYIHNQGILHLDLKPENVLCPAGGEVKVTDFGLALSRLDANQLSEHGVAQGSIDYCAPEQRHGLKTDMRADLFSFAVLAYELLTGQVPGRVFRPASELNKRLPKAVDDVFRRGLARKVHERYNTVADFHQALRHALLRRPLTAPQASALLASFLLAVWLSTGFVQALIPPPEPSARVWLVHDDEATLAWFHTAGVKGLAQIDLAIPVEPLSTQSIPGGQRIRPEIPAPPLPAPVMLIQSERSLGFYHPHQTSTVAEKIIRNWQFLQNNPTPADVNLLKAGGFDGDCLSMDTKTGSWRVRGAKNFAPGKESISVETPPDRPGNPALLLSRKGSPSAFGRDLALFQSLPDRRTIGGGVRVLRFRARAEEGEPRISIGPRYHLLIPRDDLSPLAAHMRSITTPHSYIKSTPDNEVRDYWTVNWFTPTPHWQTYVVVWESPPFNGGNQGRNLEIIFGGLGKAWLDDLELFLWE